jgi:hypothetical protein
VGSLKETLWEVFVVLIFYFLLPTPKSVPHYQPSLFIRPFVVVVVPTMSRHGNRIPSTLQAVFLASNRGMEIHVPPSSADMVFRRNWKYQQGEPGSKSLFGGSKEKIGHLQRNFTSEACTTPKKCAGRRKSFSNTPACEVRTNLPSLYHLPVLY